MNFWESLQGRGRMFFNFGVGRWVSIPGDSPLGSTWSEFKAARSNPPATRAHLVFSRTQRRSASGNPVLTQSSDLNYAVLTEEGRVGSSWGWCIVSDGDTIRLRRLHYAWKICFEIQQYSEMYPETIYFRDPPTHLPPQWRIQRGRCPSPHSSP